MRWSLRALLLIIAVVATALGIIQTFWISGSPIGANYRLFLAFYLLLLAVAIVSAIPAAARFRAGFIGASIFGALYLLCVLNAGFGGLDYSAASVFVKRTLLGYAMLGLSFMTAQLTAMLVWPGSDVPRDSDIVR